MRFSYTKAIATTASLSSANLYAFVKICVRTYPVYYVCDHYFYIPFCVCPASSKSCRAAAIPWCSRVQAEYEEYVST